MTLPPLLMVLHLTFFTFLTFFSRLSTTNFPHQHVRKFPVLVTRAFRRAKGITTPAGFSPAASWKPTRSLLLPAQESSLLPPTFLCEEIFITDRWGGGASRSLAGRRRLDPLPTGGGGVVVRSPKGRSPPASGFSQASSLFGRRWLDPSSRGGGFVKKGPACDGLGTLSTPRGANPLTWS